MLQNSSKYFRPSYYLLLLLVIAVPLAGTTYFENPIDLVKGDTVKIIGSVFIIVTLLVIMGMYFFKQELDFSFEFDKSLDPFILFFLFAATLSTIFSINPAVSFFGQYQRQIGLLTFINLAFIYFLSYPIFKEKARLRKFFLAAEFTAVVVSAYACLQILGMDPLGLQPPIFRRPISTIGSPVFLGGFLTIVFPFSVMNTSEKRNMVLRILFPSVILLGIVASQTRSAYLAAASEIIIVVIFYPLLFKKGSKDYKKKVRRILLGLLMILTIVTIASLIFPQNIFTQRFLSILNDGNNPRWILWRDSFEIFKKYPITGPGIGMFPNALEEFYSFDLRMAESGGYFDHPHNNFFYMLYSMGIIGLLAYLTIIIQGIRLSVKNIFSVNKERAQKSTSLAFLIFLTGYCVYGVTNFDDVTMMLYFFVLISVLKTVSAEETTPMKINLKYKKAFALAAAIAVLFFSINIYYSVNELRADRYFKLGNRLMSEGKFAESVNNINNAIMLNDYCATYKMALAYLVFRHCSSSENMSNETKMYLLNQVTAQIEKARNGYSLKNECDALLSLAYFEMGNEQEGGKLKEVALNKDSVNVNYRINLARYYIKSDRNSDALEQFRVLFNLRPNNVDVWLTAAFFNKRIKNDGAVRICCEKILELEPGNQVAKKLLGEIGK